MASAMGVALAGAVEEQVVTWLDLLVTWNARHDLTAARSSSELVDLMLADAMALSKHVPEGASVVDVGSGAGGPGLALALLRPDLRVTLVEPLTKRVAFLRAALAATSRLDVRVVRDKGESLVPGDFDVAISRATLAPPAWLALGVSLVHAGGDVWVLLAREPAPAPPDGVVHADAIAYAWPRTAQERRAARYVRDA